MNIKAGFLLVCFCFFSVSVNAVIYSEAVKNYQDKKYDIAYKQFLELASFGNKDAQYALGMMYSRGEGVPKNIYKSYAWVGVSAEDGNVKYMNMFLRIRSQFDGGRLIDAEKEARSISEVYGEKVLQSKIYPNVNSGKLKKEKKGSLRVVKYSAKYPIAMLKKKIFGQVIVRYIVTADGRVKYPVIAMSTDSRFNDVSLDAVQKFIYETSLVDGVEKNIFFVRNRFIFSLLNYEINKNEIVNYLLDLKANLMDGSAELRFQYASHSSFFWSYLPESSKSEFEDGYSWMLLAAQDGLPEAKHFVGVKILSDGGDTGFQNKAKFWFESSANDGHTESQLFLGMSYFAGVDFEKDERLAMYWLGEAAKTSNRGKIEFSIALATADENTLRDLNKAVDVITSVKKKELIDKLSYYEALAIVGHIANNKKLEKKGFKGVSKVSSKLKLSKDILIKNIYNRIEGKPVESLLQEL